MNKSRIYLLLAIVLFCFNCKQTREGKKVSRVKLDSIAYEVTVLEDSIQNSWQVMTKNEEEMFFNIKRLLQEIEYIPGHDPLPLDTLKKANEATQAMRYNQETMRESALIDRYDEAVSNLVNNARKYSNTVKGIERHQVAVQLLEEIPQQYQKIYLNRVHYDFHIEDYNKLVEKNKKRLEKYNPKYASLESKPMFRLSE